MTQTLKQLFLAICILGSGLWLLPAHALAGEPAPASATNPGHPAKAAQRTVVLDVPGMTCQFCPITIRKALEKVDGVIDAQASFDTKTATVVFDPSRTDPQALMRATANAGYPATIKELE